MSINIDGTDIELKQFPDGAEFLRFSVEGELHDILWNYQAGEEMALYFLVNHIREKDKTAIIYLHLPYIPHARMDRVKEYDEVFTLKYFAKFINSLNFDAVFVQDAHSNVSLALIDRVEDFDSKSLQKQALTATKADLVFFPDEGANKRYSSGFIKDEDIPFTHGIKKRDWRTGEIQDLEVADPELVKDKTVLIIDDICSYGGTFVKSTEKLMELGAKEVNLVVTHAENNILKGKLLETKGFNKVYTTDSIYTGDNDRVIVIK